MLNQYEAVSRLMERYVDSEVENQISLGNPIDNALSVAIAHIGLDAFEKGDKEVYELTGLCAPEDLIEEFRFRYPSSEWTNEEILVRADEHFAFHLRGAEKNVDPFEGLMRLLNQDENIN